MSPQGLRDMISGCREKKNIVMYQRNRGWNLIRAEIVSEVATVVFEQSLTNDYDVSSARSESWQLDRSYRISWKVLRKMCFYPHKNNILTVVHSKRNFF